MPVLSKEQNKNIACMIIQDSIKYKRNEINRYAGLYDALEGAKIIPSDYCLENTISDLKSQTTDHERKLRTMFRHIKCR